MEEQMGRIYEKKQINELLPGDIVLHPVFRSDGLMLINKNKELSASTIGIIKRHVSTDTMLLVVSSSDTLKEFFQVNNTRLFIEDLQKIFREFSKNIGVSVNITDYFDREFFTHGDTIKQDVNVSTKPNLLLSSITSSPMWNALEEKLESHRLKGRSLNVKQKLLEILLTDESINLLIEKMHSYHDVLFIHSINIALVSLLIGLTLELNEEELLDLTLAALFANVGFINISKKDFKDYLIKERTNSPILKEHLLAFSKISSEHPLLRKKQIVFGILDHHEYYNGSGFPNGKAGKAISLYGRILLLAHTYDELVGGYNYSTSLHPFEALKIIYENKHNRFDVDIIKPFFYRATIFKLGENIVTSNNEKGMIIGFTDYVSAPHLPIVKLDDGKIIDYTKTGL